MTDKQADNDYMAKEVDKLNDTKASQDMTDSQAGNDFIVGEDNNLDNIGNDFQDLTDGQAGTQYIYEESNKLDSDTEAPESMTDSQSNNIITAIKNSNQVWNELTDKQRHNLSRDAICYVEKYGPQQALHPTKEIPPCIGTDTKLCHPVRLYEFHIAQGVDIGQEWGCSDDGIKIKRKEILEMMSYPKQEKEDANCYARDHEIVMDLLCDEDTGCDADAIIKYYTQYKTSMDK
eukprot:14030462-Ditylum_brightwellii.AAC.1